MIIKQSSGHTVQSLLPVLSGGALVGIVVIPDTEFDGEYQVVHFQNTTTTHNAYCLEFSGERSTRKLFCLTFPPCMTQGKEPWNGLPNFISVRDFGIMSIWSCPVGRPDYQRTTLGMVELLTTNKYDKRSTNINQEQPTVAETKYYKLRLSVDHKRFATVLANIQFNWLALTQKHIDIDPKTVDVVQGHPTFKTILFTNSSSNGVPEYIRIIRINGQVPESFSIVLDVQGETQKVMLTFEIVLK